jgi:hypothetical protein
MKVEDLESYIAGRTDYLQEVSEILGTKIDPDEPALIKEHMTVILTHRGTLGSILAKLEKMLDDALAFYLSKKDKGDTDLDRKLKLDARVSAFRYYRNSVESLLKTTDLQVSSMQSLLSFEKKHLAHLGDTAG